MCSNLLPHLSISLFLSLPGLNVEREGQKKSGNACSLCGNSRRVLDPPALFCSGECGMTKIRRNATYYTDRYKQNHWCERCFNRLDEKTPLQLDDGRETRKGFLLKLKNDSAPEESWVQCDCCHDWNHQICALFNGSQNSKSSSFTCPKCYLKDQEEKKPAEGAGSSSSKDNIKGARELPHCNLSRSIENGLEQALSKAYGKRAKDRGCTVAQVCFLLMVTKNSLQH